MSKNTAKVRFFQLNRKDGGGEVAVETADTFVDLSPNPLLEAFLEHHDREQQMIAERLSLKSTR